MKLICMALFLAVSVVAEPFQMMTYNVWLGFNKKQNLEEGAKWIASQECDVLALQELKGFDSERLEAAAKKWGHPYALIFDRKGGFPQGLTSKTPIERIEQIMPNNDPRLRGTLHCKTAGMHFFIVHFDPRNYLRRQKEAAAVADRVEVLVEGGEKVIVLGDFNAHSVADKEAMASKTPLLEKWRAKEGGALRAFNENGELDFSVLQSLFDAGLVDPSRNPVPTFPTRLLFGEMPAEEFAGLQQRIDFILVSPPLAGGTIRYPRDPALDQISDHYPVVLEIE
ncbi:endonuclease/exonuclease/phosphatase family protein [Pontiella sulfatireligans]|nr:endonuclease/exonuclease/phosphatase family protein [Pontiella sulfatireligans]